MRRKDGDFFGVYFVENVKKRARQLDAADIAFDKRSGDQALAIMEP